MYFASFLACALPIIAGGNAAIADFKRLSGWKDLEEQARGETNLTRAVIVRLISLLQTFSSLMPLAHFWPRSGGQGLLATRNWAQVNNRQTLVVNL